MFFNTVDSRTSETYQKKFSLLLQKFIFKCNSLNNSCFFHIIFTSNIEKQLILNINSSFLTVLNNMMQNLLHYQELFIIKRQSFFNKFCNTDFCEIWPQSAN